MHDKINEYDTIKNKLGEIKEHIENLYRKAEEFADSVHFTIISDHGMTPLSGTVNIMSTVWDLRDG